MADSVRRFQDGDIIFREGAPGEAVYMVATGAVELLKTDRRGRVRLALVPPGQTFGEGGVLNARQRNVTARAVGDVLVEVVTGIADMDDQSLTKRRTANIWDMLLDSFFKPKRGRKRALEVRLAPLFNDRNNQGAERITAALAANDQINLKPVAAAAWANVKPDSALPAVVAAARQYLARESADILLWGAINEVGTTIQLRFVARAGDNDHAGAFQPADRLVLPANIAPGFAKLLNACLFAAATPRNESHRRTLRALLAKSLEESRDTSPPPPVEMTLAERATIQACFANVIATIGHQSGDAEAFRQAEVAYKDSLEAAQVDGAPLDRAVIAYHLARVRQHLGERSRDAGLLSAAADGLREVVATFTQSEFPQDWANIQLSLGAALYRLDSLKSDPEIIKAAVAAYQSALLVFTRQAAPLKWSEAKNGLGQALQMWGDVARNIELLQRAAYCCQEALQVRTREETPLLWAASQNNLGSALYQLGRLSEDSEYLEGAAEAFGKALEIYQGYGMARMSHITERNLAKAEDMLRARMARRVARLYWEDGEEEAEPTPAAQPRIILRADAKDR